MRKNVLVTLSLDRRSAGLLAALADGETDGNRSLFIRQTVRQLAAARGIDLPAGRDAELGAGQDEAVEHEVYYRIRGVW